MPRNHEVSVAEGIASYTDDTNQQRAKKALKFYRFGPDGNIELS